MTRAYRLAFTSSPTRAFSPRGASARWNPRGVLVVYTAEHPALAALEILHAWQDYDDFGGYSLYRVDIDPDAILDVLEEAPELDPTDLEETRAYGAAWAREGASVALRVPSVTAPESYDYLLNPEHPAFGRATSYELRGAFAYDPRVRELLRRSKIRDT